MNTRLVNPAFSLSILLFSAMALFSCTVNHFEYPQPTDGESLYAFPKEFKGKWKTEDSYLTVGEKIFSMKGYDSVKVVNRVGVDSTLKDGKFLKSLIYKKETRTYDTIVNYVVKGKKIYFAEGSKLGPGYSYQVIKDIIYFVKEDSIEIELNKKAFLKKLTPTRYIFNIREEVLSPIMHESSGPWWQVLLLELNSDGKLGLRQFDDKVRDVASIIYTKEDHYYFDVRWKKAELLKLTDEGIFEKSGDLFQRVTPPKKK